MLDKPPSDEPGPCELRVVSVVLTRVADDFDASVRWVSRKVEGEGHVLVGEANGMALVGELPAAGVGEAADAQDGRGGP